MGTIYHAQLSAENHDKDPAAPALEGSLWVSQALAQSKANEENCGVRICLWVFPLMHHQDEQRSFGIITTFHLWQQREAGQSVLKFLVAADLGLSPIYVP